ncbi:hypothetical protein ACFP81_11355 [Deinococcus lacus]|uniref:DUF5655 domain-containing protein n=1 Tax=Deinococcus lacus TaxID=392561 RepID=A0ABW1YH46_9DEIO
MNDFERLQTALKRQSEQRQAEQQNCEGLLNALYHALRYAAGPGLPFNNVRIELLTDKDPVLRPLPLGSWHAARIRLGLADVRVQVRRGPAGYLGEFGRGGHFRLEHITEESVTAVARQILRDVADMYAADRAAAHKLN